MTSNPTIRGQNVTQLTACSYQLSELQDQNILA